MMPTDWKVTVGTLTAVAVVSGGVMANIIAGGPGDLPRITVGEVPVATPSAPASTADPVRAEAKPVPVTSASSVSAGSVASAASAASAPRAGNASASSVSANSVSANSLSADSPD